ncbi:hypothetical protein [Pelagimonas varians]|uniref:Uncharacterized protein n=1 Tax=Pelagimonas varians TaxID=696760 RepID=A0A238KBW5_9RHOB|nr:hypothetical protein [Pelagimonas varians]PYG31128.1 hypothetical protein C8N36_105186 [Pelagimonas varians]SMX39692.1 hypothetical protein PEV8663_01826 [Pelagimonas varians]
MTYHKDPPATWTSAQNAMPAPLDCETQALLRLFLSPILETASNWREISDRLGKKGYRISFRLGRLVILNEHGDAVSTGRGLGVPLAAIAERIGRPSIRAQIDGISGELG